MGVFKDNEGREWKVKVTVGAVERVKDRTGVDLGHALDDGMKLLGELSANPGRRVAVLYAVCEPQIEARGLSPEEFADCFSGDCVEESWNVFLDSLADFFPDARHRHDLKRILTQCRAMRERSLHGFSNLANEAMDEVDRLLGLTSSTSPGNSPGSPASTPTR